MRRERLNIGRLNWRRLENRVVAQALSFRLLTISTRRMAFVALDAPFPTCEAARLGPPLDLLLMPPT